MGNQIVIPLAEDWYSNILNAHGFKIITQLPKNSLFTRFICSRTTANITETFLIKGYQDENLAKIKNYNEFKEFLEQIANANRPSIRNYSSIIEDKRSNSVFLVRPKIGKSLTEVITFQEPSLYPEEKFFITYQLFRALQEFSPKEKDQKAIFHGDLKPNNIIYLSSGRIFITDPAPFKPYALDKDHLFYHFFSADGSPDCYLSPERLLNGEQTNFSRKTADIYSLGCIIAYIYLDGKPLLTISEARKMASDPEKTKNFIKEIETRIENKKIALIIQSLIDPNPNKRYSEFYNFLDKGFPPVFKILYDELLLSTDNKITVQDFQFLIETLTKNLPENELTIGYKMILFNYFQYHCLLNNNLPLSFQLLKFMLDFSLQFDAEAKIMRALPFFIHVLRARLIPIRHSGLSAISQILKTIHSIPNHLNSFFCQELVKRLAMLLLPNKNQQNEFGINIETIVYQEFGRNCFLIAEFLPLIGLELERLNYESFTSLLFEHFSNFVPSGDLDVFKVLTHSIGEASKNGNYRYFNDFNIFVNNILKSNKKIDFLNEYIGLLIEFFSNAKESEKSLYILSLINILPTCFDEIVQNNIIAFELATLDNIVRIRGNDVNKSCLPNGWNNKSDSPCYEEFTCKFLEFLILLLERNFLNNKITCAIETVVEPLLQSKSAKVQSLLQTMSKFNTPLANQYSLFTFLDQFSPDPITNDNQNRRESLLYNRSSSLVPNSNITYQPLLLDSADLSLINPRFINSERSSRQKVTHLALSEQSTIVYATDHTYLRVLKPTGTISTFFYQSENNIVDIHFLNPSEVIIATTSGAIKFINFESNKTIMYKPSSPHQPSNCVTSFCQISSNCFATSQFDGRLSIYDLRSESRNSTIIDFPIDSLQTIQKCNENIIYAGWLSGLVSPIDLRLNLPVSRLKTAPAYHIWPLLNQNKDQSALAVYDNCNTIQIFNESKTTASIFKEIYTKPIVGCPYQGGLIVADDDSVSFIDVFRNNSSLKLFDGFKTPLCLNETNPNQTMSSPLSVKSEEYSEHLSLSSLHMHHSPIQSIAHNGLFFVTGDSLGFVNSWCVQ